MLIRLSRVFLGGGPKPCKRSQVDRSESVYCLFFFSSRLLYRWYTVILY